MKVKKWLKKNGIENVTIHESHDGPLKLSHVINGFTQSQLKELEKHLKKEREVSNHFRDHIIDAFREGRKAGAIFKTQKDSEQLAERYLRDLSITKNQSDDEDKNI